MICDRYYGINNFTGQDHERDRSVEVILDVDPDVVRKGIRNLMQQVAQIERERVSKTFS